jgi:hypothetical protein
MADKSLHRIPVLPSFPVAATPAVDALDSLLRAAIQDGFADLTYPQRSGVLREA